MPDQTLLGNRGDQLALTGENGAPGKAPRASGERTFLRIEQPFIGAERPVKPQRVSKPDAVRVLHRSPASPPAQAVGGAG